MKALSFMDRHGFDSDDVNQPFERRFGTEEIYPIHVAAQAGDHDALRALLASRADAAQRTSRGRSALEIAEGGQNAYDEALPSWSSHPENNYGVHQLFVHSNDQVPP
ncbi:unnamed protein product [Durusdinium trenchii]|uniref:Ankyrin repeat domain-containing protein n=1 Tax=Durusdinium trenchii TaxID=1381693 RepID=A0ABP0QQD2_9DINO